MILVREIFSKLDEYYDFSIQEKWDNSNFQFGDLNCDVNKVLICMDVTENTILKAIEIGANLILSHHPLFFDKILSIKKDDGVYKKLKLLFENQINVISIHTPLDLHFDGISKILCDKCLINSNDILIKNTENSGYGYYGNIDSQSFSDYLKKLKSALNISHIIYYGDEKKIISKVGVMGGSGAFSIKDSIEKSLDLLITGDIKYHDVQFAIENGLCLIDLGHFETEIYGLEKLEKLLKDNFDIEIQIFEENVFKRKII